MNGTESSISQSEFQDAIQTLQALTNKHEKTYRLEIGRYILERFFGGASQVQTAMCPSGWAVQVAMGARDLCRFII